MFFILKLRRDLVGVGRGSSPASRRIPPWLRRGGERRKAQRGAGAGGRPEGSGTGGAAGARRAERAV